MGVNTVINTCNDIFYKDLKVMTISGVFFKPFFKSGQGAKYPIKAPSIRMAWALCFCPWVLYLFLWVLYLFSWALYFCPCAQYSCPRLCLFFVLRFLFQSTGPPFLLKINGRRQKCNFHRRIHLSVISKVISNKTNSNHYLIPCHNKGIFY